MGFRGWLGRNQNSTWTHSQGSPPPSVPSDLGWPWAKAVPEAEKDLGRWTRQAPAVSETSRAPGLALGGKNLHSWSATVPPGPLTLHLLAVVKPEVRGGLIPCLEQNSI